MNRIHLRSIDLNLLVILHALLEEQGVTQAAASLHLTQSATSHALTRLRKLFNDALMERQGARMVLTPFAETLREPLSQLIEQVHRFVEPEETPLAEIKQTVHLALADYPSAILLPPLWQRLQATAPGINLVVHGWKDAQQEVDRLMRGEIGIAMSTFNQNLPRSIQRKHIGMETYIGVAAAHHPISSTPSMEEWLAYSHVIVSSTGGTESPIDEKLRQHNLQRRVALSVPGFLVVPAVIEYSDAIALIPQSLANSWPKAQQLKQFDVPCDTGSFSVDVAWHVRNKNNLAIQTTAELLKDVTSSILQLPA